MKLEQTHFYTVEQRQAVGWLRVTLLGHANITRNEEDTRRYNDHPLRYRLRKSSFWLRLSLSPTNKSREKLNEHQTEPLVPVPRYVRAATTTLRSLGNLKRTSSSLCAKKKF